MESNNRNKLIILTVVLLIIVGVGITFAFFNPFLNQTGNITIDVTTSQNATITYTNGSNLNLVARQPGLTSTSNFNVTVASEMGSVTGVYDVYWVVSKNTFVHDSIPANANDKEITYSLYSSTDNINWTPLVTNVDATGLTGSIRIAANEIVTASNGSTTKYYKMEVSYPNLPKDQSYNMEKEINSYLEIRSSM